MSREYCIRVTPVPDASSDQRRTIAYAFTMHEPKFDYEDDGPGWRVYADAPRNPKGVAKTVMRVLHKSGVSNAVVTPLPIGRWSEAAEVYEFPGEPAATNAAVAPNQIGWGVVVRASNAFEWKTLVTRRPQPG